MLEKITEGKTIKVLCCCGAGMACCMMMAMRSKEIFEKLGVKATTEHDNVAGGKPRAGRYDVVFCSKTLVGQFQAAADNGTVVIGLQNVTSKAEIEEKIKTVLLAE